eukprot:COSAG02_NODE_8419_length_2578_cov_1.135135_4_plen_243_part_00
MRAEQFVLRVCHAMITPSPAEYPRVRDREVHVADVRCIFAADEQQIIVPRPASFCRSGGAGVLYLYGLSSVDTFYRHNPDDITRGSKNAQRVSRAGYKITEIIDGMGVLSQIEKLADAEANAGKAEGGGQRCGVSALDIGASPGGWTKVLASHPAIDAVVAVDPAGKKTRSDWICTVATRPALIIYLSTHMLSSNCCIPGVTPAVAALPGVTVHTKKCADVLSELIAAGPYGEQVLCNNFKF